MRAWKGAMSKSGWRVQDALRSSNSCCGMVNSNFVGTEFSIMEREPQLIGQQRALNFHPTQCQHAMLISHTHALPLAGDCEREVAAVTYAYNVMGTSGPRKMTATLPLAQTGAENGARQNGVLQRRDSLLERRAWRFACMVSPAMPVFILHQMQAAAACIGAPYSMATVKRHV